MDKVKVLVEWHDAHSNDTGWVSRADLDDEGPAVIKSIGFLMTEEEGGKKDHVSIVQTWSEDDMLHFVFYIPVQMVHRITILEVSSELANAFVFPKEGGPGRR